MRVVSCFLIGFTALVCISFGQIGKPTFRSLTQTDITIWQPSTNLLPRSITALNSPVTENFDSLANSGASSTLPDGWAFSESGTGANSTYTAGSGSLNTGDTYSFGTGTSTERAIGCLRSNNLSPLIGASFVNNTGSTIGRITIAYTGEEWRLGNNGRLDYLRFEYSTNATSLTNGTWTGVSELDFSTPYVSGGTGAKDGNDPTFRFDYSGSFNVNLQNGSTIWIRWVDEDPAGSDDGLAIDDFRLMAQGLLAGPASISGRVVTADGRGIANQVVTVMGGDLAEPRSVRTNAFGFYRFEGLPSGQTYFLSVLSGKFTFFEPTRYVDLASDLNGLDFVAIP